MLNEKKTKNGSFQTLTAITLFLIFTILLENASDYIPGPVAMVSRK